MQSPADLTVFIAMGAGLLSFLSPCVLPLVPSYLSFVSGMSFEELTGPGAIAASRRRIILNSLFFIFGFSLVFIAMGASVSLVGQLLRHYQGAIQKLAGLLIIFFGLYITGLLKVPFLMRSRQAFSLHNRPAGYAGAALVGVSFAVAWTPCVGAILGAILTLAGTTEGASQGIILLGAYSAGLGIPFLLSSLSLEGFLRVFGRYKRYMRVLYVGGGVFLVLVGILIFTGYFTILNSYTIKLTPKWIWNRI